jgi:Protein of unknown function (DUF3618)
MNDDRSPAQIEREIELTRQRMDWEVDAIAAKLRPGRFVRDHPVPFAAIAVSFVIGVGLAVYLLRPRSH